MKTKLLLLSLTLLALLAGCAQPGPVSSGAEPPAASSSSTTAPQQPPAPSEPGGNEPYFDRQAREIFESITAGDYLRFAELMGPTNAQAYKFVEDMAVDSYEVLEATEGTYYKHFKVRFNVLKSDNEHFAAGANDWDLILGDGPGGNLFKPSHEENLRYINSDAGYDEEHIFCMELSHHFRIFETTTDFNATISRILAEPGYSSQNFLHDVIHYYIFTADDDTYIRTVDKVKSHVQKTTGIEIDYTAGGTVTADDFSSICLGHGVSWIPWQPAAKEYDEQTGQHTAVIDYYVDYYSFAVAKTIAYTYTENGDGTYRMLATEVLYDSGYGIAGTISS